MTVSPKCLILYYVGSLFITITKYWTQDAYEEKEAYLAQSQKFEVQIGWPHWVDLW